MSEPIYITGSDDTTHWRDLCRAVLKAEHTRIRWIRTRMRRELAFAAMTDS